MILYLPVELHTERVRIARMAEALASRGAIAVRIEESKLGYPIHRWTELVGGTDPWSLYRAAVVMLEDEDEGGAGTRGMQVFSLPDAHVAFAFAHMQCVEPTERVQRTRLDFRLTVGLRKIAGRWTIMHEHHSVPAS